MAMGSTLHTSLLAFSLACQPVKNDTAGVFRIFQMKVNSLKVNSSKFHLKMISLDKILRRKCNFFFLAIGESGISISYF